MKAYIFPGQGAQFTGMGKDLYEKSSLAKDLFNEANSILGFNITDLMFSGTDEDLKQTNVTQPSIFLHSTILSAVLGNQFRPDMVAGHSLGEFSALVANKTLSFNDGLVLVSKRAIAMQKACEQTPSTMAAILGLDDKIVEDVCASIDEIVVPANYNSPGQIVISGSNEGIDKAIEILKKKEQKELLNYLSEVLFIHRLWNRPGWNLKKQSEQQISANPYALFIRMSMHLHLSILMLSRQILYYSSHHPSDGLKV